MIRTVFPALLLGALIALVGCAAQPQVTAGQASPAATATTPSSAIDLFYADVMDTPGLTSTVPKGELVAVGNSVCSLIGTEGITPDNLQSTMGSSKWGPEVARVVIEAARAHLCPGKQFTSVAPAATQAPAPVASAPLSAITTRDWALIAKSPDNHIGERIVVYGYVTQFDAATGTSGFRANVDGAKHSQWYDYDTNTIMLGSDALFAEVVQDDIFRAEVTVAGAYSYTTTMGGSMTVPQLSVDRIEVIGSTS